MWIPRRSRRSAISAEHGAAGRSGGDRIYRTVLQTQGKKVIWAETGCFYSLFFRFLFPLEEKNDDLFTKWVYKMTG